MAVNEGGRNYVPFFVTALGILLFVMLYIWQSIEVTRIRLEYKALLKKQESLMRLNDRLTFEIERYRNMAVVEQQAKSLGMHSITVKEIDALELK